MSDKALVEIGGLSRRDIIRSAAMMLMSGAPLQVAFAQHVHEQASQQRAGSGGTYTPQLLTDHEYKTVVRLAELIVPADGDNGSAVDAGAPEFIDLLCRERAPREHLFRGAALARSAHALKAFDRFCQRPARPADRHARRLGRSRPSRQR